MYQTIVTTLRKSGDTIFDITDIRILDAEGEALHESVPAFVPASVLATLRREALNSLSDRRISNIAESRIFIENRSARYPATSLSEQDNVTNTLSREFYNDHGVEHIEQGLDCHPTTEGHRVMISDYCIRREIGECLLKQPTIKGKLYLERGRKRYRLEFDCKKCQMSLYDCI